MNLRYPARRELAVVAVEDPEPKLSDSFVVFAPTPRAAFVAAAVWDFPLCFDGVNSPCSCKVFSAVSFSKKLEEVSSSSFSTCVQNQFESDLFSFFAAAVILCLSASESEMLNETCPFARL